MKKQVRKLNGYMTVEAALIMSTVLLLYLFLIRSFLWIYDRCILEQDMASLALKIAHADTQELEGAWGHVVGAWDEDKYLWMVPAQPVMRKQGWEITVIGRGEGGSGTSAIQYRLRILQPIEWLRMKCKVEGSQNQREEKE